MKINLIYETDKGFETLSYEVPERVVKFTEYVFGIKGFTDRNAIKEDIKKSFLQHNDIRFTIRRIEKEYNTKVIVEGEEK